MSVVPMWPYKQLPGAGRPKFYFTPCLYCDWPCKGHYELPGPVVTGWQCPACKRCHAPGVVTCPYCPQVEYVNT
jgi:hypothetical protein